MILDAPLFPADAADAIQSQLDEHAGEVIEPVGSYRLSHSINVPSKTILRGGSKNWCGGQNGRAVQFIPDAGVTAFQVGDGVNWTMWFEFSDFIVTCSEHGSQAFNLQKVYEAKLDNVRVQDSTAHSLSIDTCNYLVANNIVIYGRGAESIGINVSGRNSIFVNGIDIEGCNVGLIHEGADSSLMVVRDIHAEGNDLFIDHKGGHSHLHSGRIATVQGQHCAWIRRDHFHNYGVVGDGPGRWSMFNERSPDTDRVMFGVPDDMVDWNTQ